jgi:hypothetical protein
MGLFWPQVCAKQDLRNQMEGLSPYQRRIVHCFEWKTSPLLPFRELRLVLPIAIVSRRNYGRPVRGLSTMANCSGCLFEFINKTDSPQAFIRLHRVKPSGIVCTCWFRPFSGKCWPWNSTK